MVLVIKALLLLLLLCGSASARRPVAVAVHEADGFEIFTRGLRLINNGKYDESWQVLMQAILTDNLIHHIDINEAVKQIFQAYEKAGKPWLGYTLLASAMTKGGNKGEAKELVSLALSLKPDDTEANVQFAELIDHDPDLYKLYLKMEPYISIALKGGYDNPDILNRVAALYGNCMIWDRAETLYSRSFELDPSRDNWGAFSSAVFMRTHICMWGQRGIDYYEDMKFVERLILEEMNTTFKLDGIKQASVFSPANVLSYAISPALKLAVAQSFSRAEQAMAIEVWKMDPMNQSLPENIERVRASSKEKNFRIRVGYVSANIKSRTTTFMAQNVLLAHDKSKFEIHVYATTPEDTHDLLYNRMRGVDWRKKVGVPCISTTTFISPINVPSDLTAQIRNAVEFFHETHTLTVPELFRLIRKHDIHILLNWDGYSNSGIRAAGIFSLNPAPVQINHQEYIGTMGSDYIHYFISDEVSTPPEYRKYYREKMILMPHSFLATSMAYLEPDMLPPERETPHPERNGCHGSPASFVYCNMNKHMKFSPDVFAHWMHILQSVPGSVLCLLVNPPQSEPHLRRFVSEIDDSLQDRIRYSEFIVNPYDNQRRVKENCNAVLDTPIYNGHTTNADTLWAGVPLVTYGTTIEVSGRVGQSMSSAVGLTQLIAKDQKHYDELAIRLGRNRSFYIEMRDILVSTCLAKNPMHPYWDLQRYTQGLEKGFEMAFNRYIDGKAPAHIKVREQFSPNDRGRVNYPSGFDAEYIEDRDGDRKTIQQLLDEEREQGLQFLTTDVERMSVVTNSSNRRGKFFLKLSSVSNTRETEIEKKKIMGVKEDIMEDVKKKKKSKRPDENDKSRKRRREASNDKASRSGRKKRRKIRKINNKEL